MGNTTDEMLVRTMSEPMLLVAADGNIVCGNDAAYSLLKMDVPELAGVRLGRVLRSRTCQRALDQRDCEQLVDRSVTVTDAEGKTLNLRANFFQMASMSTIVVLHSPENRHGPLVRKGRCQRVIEEMDEAVMIMNPAGRVEFANPAFTRDTGYRCGESVPVYHDLLKSCIGECSDTSMNPELENSAWKGELRTQRKDGSLYWASGAVFALHDEEGRSGRFAAVLSDISERRATEFIMRQRGEQLQLFMAHVPVALAMFDKHMCYMAASRRWLQDYGLTDAPVEGRCHYDVFPEITDEWRAIHAKCLSGGVERGERDKFVRADGSVIWLRWEARPWRSLAGEVGGIVIFTEDITERIKAQVAIDASEERFRATFEQAAVGMAHVDLDGHWMRVNQKLCEILGYTEEELLQSTFQAITHADDLKADLALADQLIAGNLEHYSIDKRYIRKSGDPIWIRLTASLMRGVDGVPTHFISVVEDIDQRVKAEHTLRRLRSELDEMLTVHVASQTAAAIAHELNQPLNAVTSYTEAMLRMLRKGNPRPDRLTHAIEACERQAKRAARVVRELMEFLQHGDTKTEPVDLGGVFKEALSIVQANGYGPFRTNLQAAPGLHLAMANRMQVEKVLVNLLGNALEAMTASGTEDPSIEVTLSEDKKQHKVVVTVRDFGPGMDEETMRNAFEPFFTTKETGIGMGLAVSRALMESNGGALWIEPTKPPGSTFMLSLPMAL